MRITKKYAGATSIGKVVYQPLETSTLQVEDHTDNKQLSQLEDLFLIKLKSKSLIEDKYFKFSKIVGRSSNSNSSDDSLKSSEEPTVGLNGQPRSSIRGMKRIVSAPNFLQMHSNSLESANENNLKSNYRVALRRENRPKLLSEYVIGGIDSNAIDFSKSRKRSQSVMDLTEYETYMIDDEAAGNSFILKLIYFIL